MYGEDAGYGRSWRGDWSRRRFLTASSGATAGLAGAALMGCSSGAKPDAKSGTGASSPAAKGPTASSIIGKQWGLREPDAVPRYGGTLNYASGTPTLPNLDPFQSTAAMAHQVASMAYSHLVHNSHPPGNYNETVYYPDVATSWEISDPTKFTFKLRNDVKFHNVAPTNGRALTSADVKYAVERAATDKLSPFRGTLSAIKTVDTPDATTLILNLKNFDAGLFPALADRFAWIVPREMVESGQLRQKMVGSGPFIFQQWEQDSRVHFKKNPDYYVKGAPFVDEVNFMQISDAQTRLAAFQSSKAHIAGVERQDFDTIQKDKAFQTQTYIAVGTSSIMMNYNDPRFKDERVRQAISLIANRDDVLKIQADPKGLWRGVLSAQNTGWVLSQDELKSKRFYLRQDLQEAKQKMTAAGYPDGFPTKMVYRTGIRQEEELPQYLAEIGKKSGVLNLALVPQDNATMRRNQDERKYDGLISGIDGEPLPEAFLLDYHTTGPKNGMGLSDKELDAKIEKAISIPDNNSRKEAVLNLAREILEKVMWKTNFTDNTANDQWRTDVHNYIGPVPQQYNHNGFAFTWVGNA